MLILFIAAWSWIYCCNELRVDKRYVDILSVDKMTCRQVDVDKMGVDNVNVDNLVSTNWAVDKVIVDILTGTPFYLEIIEEGWEKG